MASGFDSDYTNLKSAETLLKKYGIDMEKDSAVLSNGALPKNTLARHISCCAFCRGLLPLLCAYKI